ncbi:MAG: hypothetical protein A2600_13300 [Candidatus Lambdaproteobacteria bacterium RIFOXYD1_FULL_56_27]|uniref:Pseudouridine synthase RsuA/RluA-like domain-containing protein n=1 Tax=Candidatus Lambdaproteobacteria bacterium RIFOXYD2_FULL_56_26 TaxID=1817773 RepID=A0A1F6GSI0_9PROT|nr:MAG: hypothetical protein A2426_01310 [Candidatus Lambdaproteobacteria bacterium RIFOXYC1_FULL_56_13]OGH01126.1 MAG: hypothetical protein A2557_02730 [Candidatus Lambdaproteobacteria bacterium RIFOXYD2_FULL_56_26]OGH06992.1 MAG: hypothetical protein A2600_13300 [Candidatus Lambdaproteobacteria bacterium RIFOXYD1_FULL_56_27]
MSPQAGLTPLYGDFKVFTYRYNFPAQRLADFLTDRYQLSGPKLALALEQRIKLNGQTPAPETMILPGDHLEYEHRREDEPPFAGNSLVWIYEDEHLLALSKPPSLPVTPSGPYFYNALAILVREVTGNPDLQPLHRLDIETSGVLLFSKSKEGRGRLQPLFERQEMDKRYLALCLGDPGPEPIEGNLELDLDSKIFTKYRLHPSERPQSRTLVGTRTPWGRFWKVELQPLSGKTNQLRAHLASKGAPIVGDKKYYPDEAVYLDWFEHKDIHRLLDRLILPRQALHCQSLSFENPISGQRLTLNDPTPDFGALIAPLK